jgi:2-dehydropantoate 2-reductase
MAAALPSGAIVGCVVHFAASRPEPGVVSLNSPQRPLIIGEPSGGISSRAIGLAETLERAGFGTKASECIQADIWYKLWGNMTMNPLSALTGAATDRMIDDELVRGFCLEVMAEAAAIGARIGCAIGQSGAERVALTRALGSARTSMLQDVEAGRPLELDALVGAVREIGALAGVPTPRTDALFGLARLKARTLGLY